MEQLWAIPKKVCRKVWTDVKLDDERVYLTNEYLQALIAFVRAHTQLMKSIDPLYADCWEWAEIRFTDLSKCRPFEMEFGGYEFEDKPFKLRIANDRDDTLYLEERPPTKLTGGTKQVLPDEEKQQSPTCETVMQEVAHLLPRYSFPITVQLLHWQNRTVLWERIIEAPHGLEGIRIPGRRELGVPVIVRATFGDGEVREQKPPSDTIPN